MRLVPVALLAAMLLFPDLAEAHTEVGLAGGLSSGFLHPLTGPDHLVAMVAVGLWGALLGPPAIWVLPICFPLVMAVGGVLGVLHLGLPFPEVMIALSAIVLGLAVAFSWRAPLPVAAGLVAVFAVFHGYAHGLELPEAAHPLAYGIGFVVATGGLHLVGIGIGTLTRWKQGTWAVQGMGAAIAGLGAVFLLSPG